MILRRMFLLASLGLVILTGYRFGDSFCVLFPQNGKDIFGVEQRNFIIFRDNSVSLIPQVNFEGDARDFGILVPVPSEPRLQQVGSQLFSEASFLTQPLVRESASGCGCQDEEAVFANRVAFESADGAMLDSGQGGVQVIFEQQVGTFQAVVLQSGSAQALSVWLDGNGYNYEASDSLVLEDYVARNWYFVAMKLDTNQVRWVNTWWAATTSPAMITFDYNEESLMYPLKLSSLSSREKSEVLIYTLGRKPMRFPAAKVEYVNKLTADEVDAISDIYFTLGDYLNEGQFLVKMRRTFSLGEMQSDFEIAPTSDTNEFREIRYRDNNGGQFASLMLLVLALQLNKRKRREPDES